MDNPGAILASTVTVAGALGFVPVAVHYDFFSILGKIGPVATAEAITEESNRRRSDDEKKTSPLCLRLTQDTMFAMAGLGFVNLVSGDDTYETNKITDHINTVPSAIHGMLHFTTEPLFAAPFLMRKLVDTNFQYPFTENDTPTQYGYKLIGKPEYAKENLYTIMYMQGRMPSFDIFMEGKFGKFGTMPSRAKQFGYGLEAVVKANNNEVVVVDIGGGRGEMLLEVKQAFPHLTNRNLVLQEYKADARHTDDLTVMDWDYKGDSPQPIVGAQVYSLTHIYHNLPDLEALRLMQKVAKAMAPYSRMLIHEFSKHANYGKISATMVVQFGGRVRASRDWHQMASLCGLKVTFEAYPPMGEGLVEMMKTDG